MHWMKCRVHIKYWSMDVYHIGWHNKVGHISWAYVSPVLFREYRRVKVFVVHPIKVINVRLVIIKITITEGCSMKGLPISQWFAPKSSQELSLFFSRPGIGQSHFGSPNISKNAQNRCASFTISNSNPILNTTRKAGRACGQQVHTNNWSIFIYTDKFSPNHFTSIT